MQALLERETAQRSVDRAVKDCESAEAARIVAALHAEYTPFDAEVQALELRGDYGHPEVRPTRAAMTLDELAGLMRRGQKEEAPS